MYKPKYAIRIKPSIKSRPKTERGHVWVNETLDNYTTKKHRKIFSSFLEAEKNITEAWEIVVIVS